MLFPAGTNLGSYENLTLVGTGGMGEVYQAQDRKLERSVAIKVVRESITRDPERLARLQREARLLASLNHPNIAAIYGFEEYNGTRFLVLEFVPGENLAEVLARGPLALDDSLKISRQIAEALESAHERGIVHRDLKPANIKITPEEKVKVLDFGLAKATTADASSSDVSMSPTLTAPTAAPGLILGTAAYMSPEQARGRHVDKRVDTWAFGCVLFECLTGRRAFSGETISDTLAAVLRSDPDWTLLPSDTPVNIHTLLRRCLNKDVSRRLRDIGDARIEIEDVLEGKAGREVSSLPRGTTRSSRRELFGWLLAAISLLGVGVILMLSHVGRREERTLSPIRFEVVLPESYFFFAAVPTSLAVSPDQKHIAAVVFVGGRPQIALRSLSTSSVRLLPGTEGAAFPFWSPDSQFIGFFSSSLLRKIDLGSGVVTPLCPVVNGRGGSWNSENVILFASATVLQKVNAGGGAAVAVTKLDSGRELAHLWPCFLPDGNNFLYLANGTAREHGGIYAGQLQSGEKKLLVRARSNPFYSSAGYLLCVRDRNLTAQPFDAKRLELSGETTTLAEGLTVHPGTSHAKYGVSGDLLAYGALSSLTSQLAWFDRGGKRISNIGPPREYRAPAISSDGKKVAIEILSGGASDIWTLDLARDVFSRFTFHPAAEVTPVFSPDGSKIAFSSAPEAQPTIFVKPTSGSGTETALHKFIATTILTDWSKDGRYILFENSDVRTKSDIWALPLETAQGELKPGKPLPVVQSEFEERKGVFSSDSRWIAYTSDETGKDEVYVTGFSTAGGKWQISSNGGDQPAWSRDGKELFYLAPDKKLMSVGVTSGADNFEAAAPKALFDAKVPSFSALRNFYVADSAGRKFLFYTLLDTGPSRLNVVLHWNSGLKTR